MVCLMVCVYGNRWFTFRRDLPSSADSCFMCSPHFYNNCLRETTSFSVASVVRSLFKANYSAHIHRVSTKDGPSTNPTKPALHLSQDETIDIAGSIGCYPRG